MTTQEPPSGSGSAPERPWIYRKSTQRLLMGLLLAACAGSVVLEAFVPHGKGKFGFDGTFGFYAVLGFVSCAAIIFLARALGFGLKAPTDYYERADGQPSREEKGR